MIVKKLLCWLMMAALMLSLPGCGGSSSSPSSSSGGSGSNGTENGSGSESGEDAGGSSETSGDYLTPDDIEVTTWYEDSGSGTHAITADGVTASYSHIGVNKTGNSDAGDEADFYGDNAAVFATNGAALTVSDSLIQTNGTHANAVFSYGSGTTAKVSDSVIVTSGNCSGGLMTTGGGTTNASNLTITTSGNSSAAIRSDRGGGTVVVTGGSYTTSGTGSPVIYATADNTVSNAYLESTSSQGVVVEGTGSVTLNDCALVASNTTKNSSNSNYYQAVMIYQSMSGDADDGTSSFTLKGGSLTNANGDIFFVNNTACVITLTDADIANNDNAGVFLRAAAAGWGTSGSNGGKVNLYANGQDIDGNIIVDSISILNLYLADGSDLAGAINSDGSAGSVYVELTGGSTWSLTSDSYITSLTCGTDSISLNGHTLYVNGTAYTAGTAASGTAIAIESGSSSGSGNGGGTPPDRPQ